MVRSILGAEMLAFADAFDLSFLLKRDLEDILGKKLPLKMLTDSKCLFDIITKQSETTEKRLEIDVKAVREGYNAFEISDIGFIRSANNPADALTKVRGNDSLLKLLETNKCDFDVDKWVVRKKENSSEKVEC